MHVYSHSGAVPLGGALLAMLLGFLSAIGGGFVYAFLFFYIPIIYANILFTFGFGALIGLSVGWAARIGKIRNTFLVTSLTFIFAVLGVYVEWAAYPLAIIGWDVGLAGFSPNFLLSFMQYLYEEGSWGLFDETPVTGIFLAIVWIIEAGIILTLAITVARNMTSKQPFCERCYDWTTTETGVTYLQADGNELAWSKVVTGDLHSLNEFVRAGSHENTVVRLDVTTCPSCTDSNFLTILAMTHSVDKQGNTKEKSKPLVTNLVIDPKQVEFIRECGQPNPDTLQDDQWEDEDSDRECAEDE